MNLNFNMNPKRLLILSYILYLIPLPLIGWGGLIISAMVNDYRTEHIESIKVFIGGIVLSFIGIALFYIGIVTTSIGGISLGIIILLIAVIFYYSYMFSKLLKAIELKNEVIELKSE